MTRKLRLVTVILGVGALVLGAQSAVAQSLDLESMIQARKAALGRDFQLGDFAVNNTWRVAPTRSKLTSTIAAREKALGRNFQLGDFAVNNTWTVAEPATVASAKRPDFWNYESGIKVADTSPDIAPQDLATLYAGPETTPNAVSASGRDIAWPQVGAGLGLGIVLVLGIALAMRITHVRPFAH